MKSRFHRLQRNLSNSLGLLGALVFLAATSACQKGSVSIEPSSTTLTVSQRQAHGSAAVGHQISTQEPSIYFTQVNFKDGRLGEVTGVSYQSPDSTSTKPFTFSVSRAPGMKNLRIVVPWTGGVVYAKAVDSARDCISFTESSTLSTQELYTHDSHIVALDGSTDFKWLAWIDQNQRLYAMRMVDKKVFQLDVADLTPADLRFSSTDSLIVEMAGAPDATSLLFKLGQVPTLEERCGSKIDFSLTGLYLASVNAAGEKDILTVRENVTNSRETLSIATTDRNAIHDFVWSGDQFLAYMVMTGASGAELHIADIRNKVSSKVVTLALPADEGANMVCPTWHKQTLFYSALLNGRLVVFKVSKAGNRWISRMFAQSPDQTDGYACPKAL